MWVEGVLVYFDESLKRFTTVFSACGSSNSAIELSIDELEKYASLFLGLMSVRTGMHDEIVEK